MLRILNVLTSGLFSFEEKGAVHNPEELRRPDEAFRGHIAELDALRAFGIMMVVMNHAWPFSWNKLDLAWIMMDAFFVMSGFLIGGILLDSRERPDYYRSFYLRRTLRIFPIYYAILIPLTGAAVFARHGNYIGMLQEWGSPAWFFFYLGNIPTAIHDKWPRAASAAFTPLWSLQIEEQFYLLLPLLFRWLSLRRLAHILAWLVFISLGLRLAIYGLNPSLKLTPYVLLPCRMDGLALGAMIAVRSRLGPWCLSRTRLTVSTCLWMALAVCLAIWSGWSHETPFNRTLGFFISSIACTHWVLWLIRFRGSRLTAPLRLAPVAHLGKISYCMYLVHWPIIFGLVTLAGKLAIPELGRGWSRLVAVVVLSIVFASLSWRYFESPILRLRDRRGSQAGSSLP